MFSNIIRNQQHIVVTSDEWMGARLKRSEDFYDNSFHGGAYIFKFFLAFFFLLFPRQGDLLISIG